MVFLMVFYYPYWNKDFFNNLYQIKIKMEIFSIPLPNVNNNKTPSWKVFFYNFDKQNSMSRRKTPAVRKLKIQENLRRRMKKKIK